MPPKSTKMNTTVQTVNQPSTINHGAATTTTEEEDNTTTTEDETTQDSDYELPATQVNIGLGLSMPPIQEIQVEESAEEETDEESGEQDEFVESETEVEFKKSALLEQLNTLPAGQLAQGMHLYLLTGQALTKFVRLTKYHTYSNALVQDLSTKLAIDIARTQQVVTPLTAVNTQDGGLFVIDDVHCLMALRNLSDSVLEKLTVMLIVYDIRALTDTAAKALFTRLNTRHQFTIDTRTVSDIDNFMSIILSNPAFKDGIKSSAANKKANFPHISAAELRKSIQEVITRIRENGTAPDVSSLANRLIDFNCICKGKPISKLFGLSLAGGAHMAEIDEKTRDRYKKMTAKGFYLASPYGRCWPQFLLGRADTELVAVPKGSSAAVIPVVSQKLSFSLKKS